MAKVYYFEPGYIEEDYFQTGLSIDWGKKIIHVPLIVMTLIQTTPTRIMQLNLDDFRKALKDLEDDSEGMAFSNTHKHNTTVEVGGVVLARVLEILEPYTITFEDGQYAVNLVGANSNVGDRVNVNNVSVRSANSAGLQDLSTLLASAYGGQVIVDIITGQAGTSVPVGTFKAPSDNVADALTIAEVQGITTLYFNRSTTILEDLSKGYHLVGGSPFFVLTAEGTADLTGCSVTNLGLVGELDGLNNITRCNVSNITNMSGFMEKSALSGNLGLNGSTSIMECYTSFAGMGHPIISVGSGNLNMMDYHGSVELADITSGHHDIEVYGGRVVIAASCTAGEIHILGEPYSIVDNSGVGCTILNSTQNRKVLTVPKFIGLK